MSTALNVLDISLLNPHKHDKTAFDPISLMRNRLDNISEDAHLESGEDEILIQVVSARGMLLVHIARSGTKAKVISSLQGRYILDWFFFQRN